LDRAVLSLIIIIKALNENLPLNIIFTAAPDN